MPTTNEGGPIITLRRKAVFGAILCTVFVLGNASAIAASGSYKDGIGEIAVPSAPRGIKPAAVVRAVKVVAKGIRTGGAPLGALVVRLSKDKDAVAPLLKHATKIADALDNLAKIPDLAMDMIRMQLFSQLSASQGAFKIKPSVAMLIADEIVAVISSFI